MSDQAVGKPVDRVDGHAKTSGSARYSAEYPYLGLAYAALVSSTIARGRIARLDTAEAEAVPGVLAVITHRNSPRRARLGRPTPLNPGAFSAGARVDYLGTDEVHWNGEPIAVVVATTLETAQEAARLVRAQYVPLPAAVDFAGTADRAVPVKGNPLLPGEQHVGDAEAALAESVVWTDQVYVTPPQSHNALEPHAATAIWEDGRLTIHVATQHIDGTRRNLAARFGVPPDNVHVISTYVGGGFGGKSAVWAGTELAALAAKVVDRPVRMLLGREDVYRTVGARSPTRQRVALGADRDGRLTALVHTGTSQVSRVGGMAEPVTTQSGHLYACPNILLRQKTTTLDWLPNTFMRAPGEAMGSFALESAVDELAATLELDPIELRRRNEATRSPIDGKRFTHRDLGAVYARGAEGFGWGERPQAPRATRDGSGWIGWGMATAFYMPAQMPADVSVRVNADGTVLVRCAFQEIGVGAATAQAQITADALGVPVSAVTVEHGDSTQPVGPGAFASAQTASVAAAVLEACEEITHRVARLDRASATNARGSEYFAAVLARAGRSHLEVHTGSDSRLRQRVNQIRFMNTLVRDRRRFVRAATGAHFCQVRVDADTGEIRVLRWLGVFDVGRVINAKLASSQLRGGIVMGIGAALGEETLVDSRDGRIMNANLAEYHVPVHADVPRIEVEYLDQPDPTAPLGLLGVGEVSITGTAAAIANAVYHATGTRVRELPITLDRLL